MNNNKLTNDKCYICNNSIKTKISRTNECRDFDLSANKQIATAVVTDNEFNFSNFKKYKESNTKQSILVSTNSKNYSKNQIKFENTNDNVSQIENYTVETLKEKLELLIENKKSKKRLSSELNDNENKENVNLNNAFSIASNPDFYRNLLSSSSSNNNKIMKLK